MSVLWAMGSIMASERLRRSKSKSGATSTAFARFYQLLANWLFRSSSYPKIAYCSGIWAKLCR